MRRRIDEARQSRRSPKASRSPLHPPPSSSPPSVPKPPPQHPCLPLATFQARGQARCTTRTTTPRTRMFLPFPLMVVLPPTPALAKIAIVTQSLAGGGHMRVLPVLILAAQSARARSLQIGLQRGLAQTLMRRCPPLPRLRFVRKFCTALWMSFVMLMYVCATDIYRVFKSFKHSRPRRLAHST